MTTKKKTKTPATTGQSARKHWLGLYRQMLLIRLVEELIPEKQKSEITRQLIKGGLPDKTIAGALKAVLATVGKKVAGELGDQAGKSIGDEIGEIFTGGWRALVKLSRSK